MARREKLRLKTFIGMPPEIEQQYNEWADTLPDNAVITSSWSTEQEVWGALYPRMANVFYVTYEIGADGVSRGAATADGYLR